MHVVRMSCIYYRWKALENANLTVPRGEWGDTWVRSNQGNKMAIFGENAMAHISTTSAWFLLQKYALESPFKHLLNNILFIEIGPEGAMLGTLLWPHPGGPCPGVAFLGYFPCPILWLCTNLWA